MRRDSTDNKAKEVSDGGHSLSLLEEVRTLQRSRIHYYDLCLDGWPRTTLRFLLYVSQRKVTHVQCGTPTDRTYAHSDSTSLLSAARVQWRTAKSLQPLFFRSPLSRSSFVATGTPQPKDDMKNCYFLCCQTIASDDRSYRKEVEAMKGRLCTWLGVRIRVSCHLFQPPPDWGNQRQRAHAVCSYGVSHER